MENLAYMSADHVNGIITNKQDQAEIAYIHPWLVKVDKVIAEKVIADAS